MTFPYWQGQRPPAPPPEPETLPAPVLAGLADEFTERSWGSQGETFAPEPHATTTVTTGLVIEPPPWAGQAPLSAPQPDTGLSLTAPEQMQLDGEVYDPAPFRPPASSGPLRPCHLEIPAPDWREVES